MDAATPTPGESLCRPLPGTGHGWQPGRTATASTTPFGQLASQTGSLTHNLRLPGQYADIKTGLYQNWWRDYDPALGRYLQADPIGLAGGANLYGYVEGNPVSKIDLPGLFKICCRPLSGLPFMGPQVGADLGIYHEHGFFEDEKGGNIGFGPDGLFAKGNKTPCCGRWWRQKEGNRRQPAFPVLFRSGGGNGIRTREELPPTRFPGVRLKPLGHFSIRKPENPGYMVV